MLNCSLSPFDEEMIASRIKNYDRWNSEFTFPDDKQREAAIAVDEALANFTYVDPRDLSGTRFVARSWKLTVNYDLSFLVKRMNTAREIVIENQARGGSSSSAACCWGSNIQIWASGEIQILDGQPSTAKIPSKS